MVGFQPIIQTYYATLVLPRQFNNFLDGYLKYLLRFDGEIVFSVEDNLVNFLDFANNMNKEHEYVSMRLFFQSLEGNVRISFI